VRSRRPYRESSLAWARLQQRMRAIRARRTKLRPQPPSGRLSPTRAADSGFAERASAAYATALLRPTRYRNEVEQLARESAQPKPRPSVAAISAGARGGRSQVRTPARAKEQPDLISASTGRSTRDEHGGADDSVLRRDDATSRSQTARRSTGTRAASGAPPPQPGSDQTAIASSGSPAPLRAAPHRREHVRDRESSDTDRPRHRRSAHAHGAHA